MQQAGPRRGHHRRKRKRITPSEYRPLKAFETLLPFFLLFFTFWLLTTSACFRQESGKRSLGVRTHVQPDPPKEMAIKAYLLGVNALAFIMHAEDKLAAGGWLPMFGRIPGSCSHVDVFGRNFAAVVLGW